ncbi:MAG: hypothetical protein HY320_11465 [Armatimonadetes bacterium]|nr:hypothetical protein [Armatimonadota bacterium]
MFRNLSLEARILLLICSLDAVTSAILFASNMAVEANPLLRPYAEAGPVPFLLAKLLTYIPTILLAEKFAQRRPRLVRPLMRATIVAYLGIYCYSVGAQFLVG